ncbi:hypothetical protein BCV70DRAFT_61392 [Testicularia cyperi]|uniref:Uncharacterized protein n=1 Tax=Testicularia cyperi TaxID=1882483 RepID=A0A317XWL0_9BASI|nr:hypothetical protein BCV70DRAFT_61392 [Testicularia cyperi]
MVRLPARRPAFIWWSRRYGGGWVAALQDERPEQRVSHGSISGSVSCASRGEALHHQSHGGRLLSEAEMYKLEPLRKRKRCLLLSPFDQPDPCLCVDFYLLSLAVSLWCISQSFFLGISTMTKTGALLGLLATTLAAIAALTPAKAGTAATRMEKRSTNMHMHMHTHVDIDMEKRKHKDDDDDDDDEYLRRLCLDRKTYYQPDTRMRGVACQRTTGESCFSRPRYRAFCWKEETDLGKRNRVALGFFACRSRVQLDACFVLGRGAWYAIPG